MKSLITHLTLPIVLVLIGFGVYRAPAPATAPAVPAARVPVQGPVYSVVDFGAVADGLVSSAGANTTAFNAAFAAAGNPAAPGSVDVPPASKSYVVTNGQLRVNAPNVTIRGHGSMGSNLDRGPTSTIVGSGSGHTLTITQPGGMVSGLEFRPVSAKDQKDSDACLMIQGTAVSVYDCHFQSPNIGISLLSSPGGGLYWIRDVLIEGSIKYAGISVNIGNQAAYLQNVVMASNDPQPPYGVLVTSCGQLNMSHGCNLINCGNCLALVPGLNGVKDQFVTAAKISDCLFDGGNGQGAFLICPTSNGWVSIIDVVNCWASTFDNGGGQFPTNGYTVDGSQAKPVPGIRPITRISFLNCEGRNFKNHCGLYAKNVYGLDVSHSMMSNNFMGIQTYGCVGICSSNMCGDFSALSPGNQAYGVLLEKSQMVFNPGENLLLGNGLGAFKILP